ncbi:MAG: polysaccharide biosynthesis C-terminal domain-containing protein [Bacteroidales bacterium]
MLKDILGTVCTRYLIALLNLALIVVNAKVLGIEGVGFIGLFWASISINVTVNSIFSGNTIVFFLGKYPVRTLFPIAVAWAFAGSALGCCAMYVLGLLPEGYAGDVYGITVLHSLAIANSRFLLGKDRIGGFNLTNLLQGGGLFFIVLYFYYVAQRQVIGAYIWGLYLTNGIALLASMLLLLPHLTGKEPAGAKSFFAIVKEMFVYGLWGSADNIAETCAMRLNYFLVERFGGLGSVGLLDAGTKISESVWNISRSVASIEYNRIAKTTVLGGQKKITLRLLKLTFAAVAVVMALILLAPEWIFTDYLFNRGFEGIRGVIAALAGGIVAMGCNHILSHYFIGSGRVKYSTASSCIGLITLLLAGSALIPAYGVTGAALGASIAFLAMSLFSLTMFIRQTGCTFRDFLPCRDN